MSSGRWTMRGRAFQAWAFRPWALAGGVVIVITPGTPDDGWTFSYESTVWTFGIQTTVLAFGLENTVWTYE